MFTKAQSLDLFKSNIVSLKTILLQYYLYFSLDLHAI